MKSNYDLLGNHIRLIDNRNKDLVTEQVLGINIDKFFMPSVANVIGTDLSKYKLIQKGNFACNPMHVGRDERLPVALYSEDTPAIVSPAYFMFEIKDTTVLNADFLMMWFRRPEFDRICWLHTDGSVRGGITWDDICRMEIPVPPIDEQIEIVSSYQAITERIKLKKQINDNLEAQAQAVLQDKINSSGVETTVDNLINLFDSMRRPMSSLDRSGMEQIYPYYGAASLMDYVDNYIFDGIYGLLGEDGTVMDDNGYPTMQYVWGKFWVNNHAHIFQGKNGYSTEMVYLILKNTVVRNAVTGAVQLKINQENLRKLPVVVPCDNDLTQLYAMIDKMFLSIRENRTEIEHLSNLKDILLAKMSD
jgi:type I restriction enzyme S subunit